MKIILIGQCYKDYILLSEEDDSKYNLALYSLKDDCLSGTYPLSQPCLSLDWGHKQDVVMVACPDYSLFFSIDPSFKELARWPAVFSQNLCAFSSRSDYLAASSASGDLCVWRYNSKEKVFQKRVHDSTINSIDFSPECDMIATSAIDCQIHAMDGSHIKTLVFSETANSPDQPFFGVRFSKSGDLVYTVAGGNLVYLTQWSVVEDFTPISTHLIHRAPLSCFCISIDGFFLGAGTSDGWFKIINTRTMELEQDIEEFNQEVKALSYTIGSRAILPVTKDTWKQIPNNRGEGLFSKLSKIWVLSLFVIWIYLYLTSK